MAIKQDEGGAGDDVVPADRPSKFGRQGEDIEAARSDFSSTFQSIDFPPQEHEAQLQAYEAEVRNHIKVEQQQKLHIEIL